MKLISFIALLSLLSTGLLPAITVRLAPNIRWLDATGKLQSLDAFRGQPVVVIVARSPRDRLFRAQVGQLQKMYQRYAAHNVLFIAAFTDEQGRIKSNIPFVLAPDGPRTALDFQISGRFGIAFIGRDGNVDYVTDKVLPAQRIYDVIGASYVTQEKLRRP